MELITKSRIRISKYLNEKWIVYHEETNLFVKKARDLDNCDDENAHRYAVE